MEFTMKPIGIIYSPFKDKAQTPIQPNRSQAVGQVEVYSKFAGGLEGLEGFSYIFLLYAFHQSSGYTLQVQPFLDHELHGLFATRHPCRPNPIGLSIVRLLACHDNILEIEGVDVLDGTPLLDIKPYVPDFDVRTDVQTGWYAQRSKR
ncbi:MAG: tRNA (N6-threonylcarbamoyladenosine(37)-N6)-methyltransferase TrmO [Anaerolineales bacterium]|nr:tRNA (N6-threonylcarbamoyladenosine(37)-N6)-methyltransferase TrmO [Anaerolineales bacterium]